MFEKKTRYHINADDIQLYISFKLKITREQYLTEMIICVVFLHWEINSLVLNPNTTKYMMFGMKISLNSLPNLNITFIGQSIERENEARNLDLLLLFIVI